MNAEQISRRYFILKQLPVLAGVPIIAGTGLGKILRDAVGEDPTAFPTPADTATPSPVSPELGQPPTVTLEPTGTITPVPTSTDICDNSPNSFMCQGGLTVAAEASDYYSLQTAQAAGAGGQGGQEGQNPAQVLLSGEDPSDIGLTGTLCAGTIGTGLAGVIIYLLFGNHKGSSRD